MTKYQVTMFSKKYRPVSAIVKGPDDLDLMTKNEMRSEVIQKGVQAICLKRYWRKADLIKYEYKTIKIRIAENQQRR